MKRAVTASLPGKGTFHKSRDVWIVQSGCNSCGKKKEEVETELRKNGYETESYSVLLFYYPDKINENGDVLFRHKLVKIETSIQNAERLVQKAIHVLDDDMPQSSEHCDFCRWAKDSSPLRN